MKLDTEFIKLPLRFDSPQLVAEVTAFSESDWKPHPQGYAGNSAISLIAAHGDASNDSVKGPMRPTPYLDRCPYLRQVLASLQAVLGRTRLMRIAGQAEATLHVDSSYYWLERVRVHVPIITWPDVQFLCGDKSVHMAPGECWVFDTWRLHNVINPADKPRIHLVVDTVGSAPFWELLERGDRPFANQTCAAAAPRQVSFDPRVTVELETETVNFPVVMSPWELESQIQWCLENLQSADVSAESVSRFRAILLPFQRSWKAQWAKTGTQSHGFPAFRQLLNRLEADLAPLASGSRLKNHLDAVEALRQSVMRPALNPDLVEKTGDEPCPPVARPFIAKPQFERPVFIVAAPRSGSTLLFETLARSPSLYTIGGESHREFESIEPLAPRNREFESNRLTAEDATQEVAADLRERLAARLRDRSGQPPRGGVVRLLEKTPKNALRIPFLNRVFPEAQFVYLMRNPRGNLSSIIDAWRSARFVTYPGLPGWQGLPWSLLLTPKWQQLAGAPLGEIAAEQYASAHRHIIKDLSALPPQRWCFVSYEEFIADPQSQVERLCRFLGIEWDEDLRGQPLPLSRFTLTPPDPEKWRKNATDLEPVLPQAETVAAEVRRFVLDKRPSPMDSRANDPLVRDYLSQPRAAETANVGSSSKTAPPRRPVAPLHCINTTNFPKILEDLGISLLVTTYQAGKLIALRAENGQLNAHFRNVSLPMGLAYHRRRLAVGGKVQVWEFQNQPEVARKIAPAGKYDGCFLTRQTHTTGDIRVHEVAYAGNELWIVNTRFSCLCTLDARHSFVPRWRPPFVSALAPEDRCHLNGLAVVDGRPKYVTCHGESDAKDGWREDKARGGCLVDVQTNEVLLRNLSMPHSPRWHARRLWLLESGDGSLAHVTPAGELETLVRLPGFTRGLDFYRHFAFVGLSKVRESAVFSGIPITDRLQERNCGVWVIDLRTGKTAGFLRFESGVEEVFAVQVLPGVRYPEIAIDDEELLGSTFVLPQEALGEVPQAARG